MVITGGQVHIPPSRLGNPLPGLHGLFTVGAKVFRPGHGSHGRPFIGVAPVDPPGDAAGQLRAVEPVFVGFHGPAVLRHAPLQIQTGTDQRRVVGVAQGVVGRTGGNDAQQLQCRL